MPRGKGVTFVSDYGHALECGDWRRIQTCLKKGTYTTVAEAEAMIRICEQKRGVTLRWYECPYCGKYHITHQPLREMCGVYAA